MRKALLGLGLLVGGFGSSPAFAVSPFDCPAISGMVMGQQAAACYFMGVNPDGSINVSISPSSVTPTVNGSTTITAGGTAQTLFSSATPTNGWTVINPDATEDCWASDTTTAAANNTGSIRLAANGGGYETPPGRKPLGAVSVVCATTGHKLTASKW